MQMTGSPAMASPLVEPLGQWAGFELDPLEGTRRLDPWKHLN